MYRQANQRQNRENIKGVSVLMYHSSFQIVLRSSEPTGVVIRGSMDFDCRIQQRFELSSCPSYLSTYRISAINYSRLLPMMSRKLIERNSAEGANPR